MNEYIIKKDSVINLSNFFKYCARPDVLNQDGTFKKNVYIYWKECYDEPDYYSKGDAGEWTDMPLAVLSCEEDNNGKLTPVVYLALDDGTIDYSDPLFYIGVSTIDNVLYDKWQSAVRNSSGTFSFDDFAYTEQFMSFTDFNGLQMLTPDMQNLPIEVMPAQPLITPEVGALDSYVTVTCEQAPGITPGGLITQRTKILPPSAYVLPAETVYDTTVSIKPTDTVYQAGTYFKNQFTVPGDENLYGYNIRKGVSLFGVTGTYSVPEPWVASSTKTLLAGSSQTINLFAVNSALAVTTLSAYSLKLTIPVGVSVEVEEGNGDSASSSTVSTVYSGYPNGNTTYVMQVYGTRNVCCGNTVVSTGSIQDFRGITKVTIILKNTGSSTLKPSYDFVGIY